MKVTSIGAGLVGASWCAAFLRGGHEVVLFDRNASALEAGRARALRAFDLLQQHGIATEIDRPDRLLTVTDDLSVALKGADYVQESISETVGAKRALFEAIDGVADPHTIFGSSTSSIPGTGFMGQLALSARALVVHPTNPPHIIPLVELCRTPWTNDHAVAFARDLLSGIGRVPVEVRREVTGYILNRLQAAVVGEALHLVGEGYISAPDLDRVMSHGLAPRWSLGGPFLTGHLNASDGYGAYMKGFGAVYRTMIADLNVDYAWSDTLIDGIDTSIRETYAGISHEELEAARDAALLQVDQLATKLRAFALAAGPTSD